MMSDFILMLTCGHPVLYTVSLLILSGFLWLIIFILASRVTDAEMRYELHTRGDDDHEPTPRH